MRFVKRNNSFFIIGDNEVVQSLSQLEDFGIELESTKIYKIDLHDLTYPELNSKASRLHSNRTKYILECLHQLNFNEMLAGVNLDRVGIYVNGSHNYIDISHPRFDALTDEEGYYRLLRNSIAPTYSIKNDIGIVPGHIAIKYNLHGPSFVMTSLSKNQLLEKVSMDLESSIIDLGLLCFLNTYEDPMVLSEHAQLAGEKNIYEAVGVIVIKNDNDISLIRNRGLSQGYFGYLNDFDLI